MDFFGFDPMEYIDEEILYPWLGISALAEVFAIIMLKKWAAVAPLPIFNWVVALVAVPVIMYFSTKWMFR